MKPTKTNLAKKGIDLYNEIADRLHRVHNLGVLACFWQYTKAKGKPFWPARTKLTKRELDGDNWTVIVHPNFDIWMNESERAFKIIKDDGYGIAFGYNAKGKPFMKWLCDVLNEKIELDK